MTRKNIFELLKNQYNIVDEINKISNLFYTIIIIDNRDFLETNYTIETFFETFILPTWRYRGSYLNCKELKKTLKIPSKFSIISTEDEIITTLEYYNNLCFLLVTKYDILNDTTYVIDNDFRLMIENMKILQDYLNIEIKIFEKEEQVILIKKDPEAIAVAEISSEETAKAILMYNHASLKGNLEEKRNILAQIAREYETVLDNPIEGYSDFFKQTNGLLNNLHIRHNNKDEDGNKNLVINLEDSELENWYDETYQLLLFCVLIKDNLERKANVKEFFKTLKGANG